MLEIAGPHALHPGQPRAEQKWARVHSHNACTWTWARRTRHREYPRRSIRASNELLQLIPAGCVIMGFKRLWHP